MLCTIAVLSCRVSSGHAKIILVYMWLHNKLYPLNQMLATCVLWNVYPVVYAYYILAVMQVARIFNTCHQETILMFIGIVTAASESNLCSCERVCTA